MEAQLPPNWKGLNIDRYDGTTNPESTQHMTQLLLMQRAFSCEH